VVLFACQSAQRSVFAVGQSPALDYHPAAPQKKMKIDYEYISKKDFEKACVNFFYNQDLNAKNVLEHFVNAEILAEADLNDRVFQDSDDEASTQQQSGCLISPRSGCGFILLNGNALCSEEHCHTLTKIRNRIRADFHRDSQMNRNKHVIKSLKIHQEMKARIIAEHEDNSQNFVTSRGNYMYILDTIRGFLVTYSSSPSSQFFISALKKFLDFQRKKTNICRWVLPGALLTEVGDDQWMDDVVRLIVSICSCPVIPNAEYLVPPEGLSFSFELDQGISDRLLTKIHGTIHAHTNHPAIKLPASHMGSFSVGTTTRKNTAGNCDQFGALLPFACC